MSKICKTTLPRWFRFSLAFPVLGAAFHFLCVQPAAAGHVTVYVQPYGVDLQVQGVMVAGEDGGMDIRGLKDDVQPEGVAAVLLDRDRQILALSSNFVAGADGVARGSMDCSTEEIGAIFASLDGMAVREFSLAIWDATGGHLVGVGRAQMRNNPLLPDVWESWTNVTVLASNEWRMAVAGLQAGIDANAAAIAALQGASSTNASGVAELWGAVATNAAGIEALRGATGTNAEAIAELRGATATNASGIASLWEALVATSNAIPTVVDWSARWAINDLEHASLRAATNLLHGSVAANTAGIASLWEALRATSNAIPSVVDWSSRWESNDLEHARFRSATNWLRNSMSNNSVRLGTLQTNLQLASNVFPLVWAAISSNRAEVANAIYEVWQGVFAASNAIPSLDGMASEEWVEGYVAEHAPDWDPPTNMATKVYVDEVVWGLSHLIPAITTTNPAVATSNILAFAAAIAELQEQAEAAGVSIEELEESVAAVVSTNAYTLAVFAALRQQVSSYADDIGALQGATNALDEGVSGNAAAIASLAQQVEDIEIGELGIELYVECVGGWHYPDYFFASARPGGEAVETEVLSSNQTVNVIETLRGTEVVRGWVLSAEIERQSEWGSGVEWELGPECEGLWDLAGDRVVPDGATVEDLSVGDVFTATGRMGDFERHVEMEVTSENVSTTGAWQWDGWAEESLAWNAWDKSEDWADWYSNRTANIRSWPEGTGSGTNHVVAGWTNSWIVGRMFSGVSYHTDTRPDIAGGVYRPLTLVTPRHAVCANHFKPLIGSNVYWVGHSGAIFTNRVLEYKNIRGDLTVARLAEPMNDLVPGSDVIRELMLPYLLPGDYEPWFYGCEHGGVGCPGLPVVSLDCAERAYLTYWQCDALLRGKRARDKGWYTVKARGAGTAHGRKQAAVGGDSGSPTFIVLSDEILDEEGDYASERPILLGCFHTSTVDGGTAGGPIPLVEEVNGEIAEWGDEERAEAAPFEEGWGFEPYDPGMTPW